MRRHDVDLIALIAGVVLCGIGGAGLLVGPFDVALLKWVWPGLLIVVGLSVLLGAKPRGNDDS